MKTTFKVNNLSGSSTTQYGWLVQHIHIDYNVAYDTTNAVYRDPNLGTAQYPYDYWEAWRVNNDGGVWATDSSGNIFASAEDTYQTPTFPDNTHGYYNVTGTLTVFSLGAVGSTGPLTWGNVAFAGSLPSTATEPSWWAGNAYYNHNLRMSWE